jgi:Flp pilus assembly protein TadD
MFPALHHDPLIWDCLSGTVGDRILDLNSTNPDDYSPAALSLISLEVPTTADQLRSAPKHPVVDEEVDEWEVILADIPLAQAGLLALEMRERHRATGSWAEVISEVTKLTPTALACLYGMIPEPIELLQTVIKIKTSNTPKNLYIDLAMHALLSNPLPPNSHINTVFTLIDGLSSTKKLNILKLLSSYRPELAAKLSQRIRNDSTLEGNPRSARIEYLIERLAKHIQSAELHNLESESGQTIADLEESINTAKLLEARLAAKAARVASRSADPQKALVAWEQANELDPESPDIQAGYAITLVDENRTADAQSHISDSQDNHPALLLATAAINLKRGEHENARHAACQALELIKSDPQPLDIFPTSLTSRLAEILLELNLPRDATQAAELAASQNPNDPEMLSLLTCAWSAAVQPEAALLSAHLAVTASPERHDLRLQLAESQEMVGDWSAALKQRSLIIEELDAPPESELLSLASCAIYAGQPESATQVCQHLLELDKNDGEAMVVFGKAKAVQGDTQSALEYLHQGTQFLPDQSSPWLELAGFYMDEDQKQKALETLQVTRFQSHLKFTWL